MALVIHINVDAQSPTAAITSAGMSSTGSSPISIVNGDTRAFRIYAENSAGNASTDYTPTLYALKIAIGTITGSGKTILASADSSSNSGDYWDVTLTAVSSALTTLLADGKKQDVTLEITLVKRSDTTTFTPVVTTATVIPDLIA